VHHLAFVAAFFVWQPITAPLRFQLQSVKIDESFPYRWRGALRELTSGVFCTTCTVNEISLLWICFALLGQSTGFGFYLALRDTIPHILSLPNHITFLDSNIYSKVSFSTDRFLFPWHWPSVSVFLLLWKPEACVC